MRGHHHNQNAMKTLIQLVGQQAMPNLLAAIAIKPNRIVHLWTAKTRTASENLRNACNKAGIGANIQFYELSETPGINETKAAVSRIADSNPGCVVNFTGGTKLMSIGAYAAAADQNIPSLYVDTDTGVFRDGATAAGFPSLFVAPDTSLTTAMSTLNVDTIACANGVPFIVGGKDWRRLVPLAEFLLRNSDLEAAAFHAVAPLCDEIGRMSDWFEKRDAILRLLNRPVSTSFPNPVCELAEQCGLFVRSGNAFRWNPGR